MRTGILVLLTAVWSLGCDTGLDIPGDELDVSVSEPVWMAEDGVEFATAVLTVANSGSENIYLRQCAGQLWAGVSWKEDGRWKEEFIGCSPAYPSESWTVPPGDVITKEIHAVMPGPHRVFFYVQEQIDCSDEGELCLSERIKRYEPFHVPAP